MYKVYKDNEAFDVANELDQWIVNSAALDDIHISKQHNREYIISHKAQDYTVRIHDINRENKELILFINGKRRKYRIKEPIDLFLSKLGIDTLAKKKAKNIKAPMPGLILKILVKPGDSVQTDDPILILEAMKMENVFKAPNDAVIKEILIKEGDAVDKNQELILFE